MLNVKILIDDLFKIINQFGELSNLKQFNLDFFKRKILQLNFKSSVKNDFHLSFQNTSLVDWLSNLDELGKLIIQKSLNWSNSKLEFYQVISFDNQIKSVLIFNFSKKHFLRQIFKSNLDSNYLFNDLNESTKRQTCIINFECDDEWLKLRIKVKSDFLINILNSLSRSTFVLTLDKESLKCFNNLDILDQHLNQFQALYLIAPKLSQFNNLANLTAGKNFKQIKIGNVSCDCNYSTYKLNLSKELKDEFDDEMINELIKMKLLSYKSDHFIKLDLDYKQIVFLHYNYARVYTLIQKCFKIFNSKFEIEDHNLFEDQSNRLLNELQDYTFNNHFISLASFKFNFNPNQIELASHKITNQLISLCNDLSKYYHKKKVLDFSPHLDLISFKVNLLSKILDLINLYFKLLGIKPMKSI